MAKNTLLTPDGKKYTINDNDEIHRGGEGRIMLVSGEKNIVAKIYHDNIQPISQEQFNYLSKLNPDLFVIPKELLLQPKNNEIVGFTMEYLSQDFVPLAALLSKNFCTRNNFTDDVKRLVYEKLIFAVEYAHKNNLVIGDLNQYNILINNKGELRLIDCDSYQTPQHKHSGLLLEDIRDYLFGGKVNQESDYFALSVLLFYSFTFTHPFKGIHKKYKTLAERMIHKIPVFVPDPELITPKCYEPVQDTVLQEQFNRLYLIGERFLFSLKAGFKPVSAKATTIVADALSEKDLNVTAILLNKKIRNIEFTSRLGYIETDNVYFIYNAANKGYVSLLHQIQKEDYRQLFVTNSMVYLRKKNRLFHYKNTTEIVEITNFEFEDDSIVYQLGNILVGIGQEIMLWVYLDEVHNNSVRIKRTEVFGRSFSFISGLVQHNGDINRIFYNPEKDIAIVKLEKKIKDIYQQENIGIIQYIENNSVKNSFLKIKGLSVELSPVVLEQPSLFAFRPTQQGEGFVFEPNDGAIKIRRTQDWQVVSEMECRLVTSQSKLQSANSGIVVLENDSVFLLNKK